jgi:hypothetical protein
MPNRNGLLGMAALAVALIFVTGVVKLFILRFEGGDVYPPYSSLRADPIGMRALYESLAMIPGATVARNLKPLEVLAGTSGVVFYNGVDPWKFRDSSHKTLTQFETLLQHGARLIVSFQPRMEAPTGKGETGVVNERWGVQLANAAPEKSDDDEEEEGPPRETLLYFDHLDPSWQILYRSTGHATVIVRPLGNGSIALVANGYLLSNEALLESRDTELLASLIRGAAPNFTFDEYHFGISETGSVVALARKYGLSGLAAGLALLFALFVWQSSASFLPPREEAEVEVLGKSAVSGFVNLLRRGVARPDLLPLCAKEWRRSLAPGSYYSSAKLKQVEEVAAGTGDPVGAYQRISRILAERNIR